MAGRRTFLIAGALITVALLLLLLRLTQPKLQGTIQDPSFHFTFCKITRGTNHTAYSGIPILAKLNKRLKKSGHRPINSDQEYQFFSPWKDDIMLTVGFKYDGIPPPAEQMFLDPKTEPKLVDATIIMPGGIRFACQHMLTTPTFRRTPPLKNQLHVDLWNVSPALTDLTGAELQFTRADDGKPVATFKLH